MQDYLLSICIISYNRSDSLEKQLAFLKSEQLHNIQILVVDNASEDNTYSVLQKYNDIIENFEFSINETNIGADGSIRKALDLAKGEYVLFLGDDLFLKDKLSRIIDLLRNYSPSIFHLNNNIYAKPYYFVKRLSYDEISTYISKELSSFMFMSGNIYKTSILKTNKMITLEYSTTLQYSICCLINGELLYYGDYCIEQDTCNISWTKHANQVWFDCIPQIFKFYKNKGFSKKQINTMKNRNYGFFLFCCKFRFFSTIKYIIKKHNFIEVVNLMSLFFFIGYFFKRLFQRRKEKKNI